MGLLSWFFPSAEDRVERGQRLLDAGRWADARLEVLDLDHSGAAEVLKAAESALAQMNLQAAVSWAEAGDDDRVMHHMELADTFHSGGLEEDFRDARRQMREIRRKRTEDAKRAEEAEAARLMGADPLGVAGGPSWRDRTLPTDFLDASDEEASQRLALVLEGYAADIRQTVGPLGAPFARAILDFQDGRTDLAIQALLELPDDAAVVRYERARCAYTLKDPRAAARELNTFATLVGGHRDMGEHHTGTFLALCLTEQGDLDEALRVLRSLRVKEPERGAVLYAQLLEATGALEESEAVLAGLIRKHPSDPGLYKLLARVRVAGGQRKAAMAALESSLNIGHCTPGKCGYRKPDLGAMRSLATLYLEDGIETERALDLAQQATALVEQPVWEDAYLAALVAKAGSDPRAPKLVENLWLNTPKEDPRTARLTQYLPAATA